MPRPTKTPAAAGALSSKRFLALALLLLTAVAYANSFGLGLALDARTIVTEDTRIRSASADNLRQILATDYWWPRAADRLYRPVTLLTFLFDYAILGHGESPGGYHAVNFCLHAMNVLLAFALALRLFDRVWHAAAAAALWAVHPICTETVANVAGRADLLATGAILGALWIYAKRKHDAISCLGLFALAVAGDFSKESAAVLVGLMLLCDLSILRRSGAEPRYRISCYAAAAGSLLLLWWARAAVFASLPWPRPVLLANPLLAAPFSLARLTAAKVIGEYLGLLVWPAHLSSDRSFDQTPVATWADPGAWLAVAVIGSILAVVLIRYRRDPLIFWAAGFFAIALLPVSNLLLTIGSVMAERFLYLPSFGFAIAAVALIARLLPARVAGAVLASILLFATLRTLTRNADWRDDLSLTAADVTTAPRSYGLHQRLANALYEHDPRANLDSAIREAETAWRIQSKLPLDQRDEQNPANLGAWYRDKGDTLGGPPTAEGRVWYDRALDILQRGVEVSRARERAFDQTQIAHGKPLTTRAAMQNVYFNLGAVNARLGRYPQALDSYLYGRNINPGSGDPYREIAAVHAAMGNWRGAAIALQEEILLGGVKPDSIATLREVYLTKLSAGCAMDERQGGLNYACPAVRQDVCAASADLEHAYSEARQPRLAHDLVERARQNGCP